MFDLINIFDVFIPQLLQYPNAKDPLNTDAALTYIKDKKEYEKKVRNYVKGFAYKQPLIKTPTKNLKKRGSCSSDKKTVASLTMCEEQDDELS